MKKIVILAGIALMISACGKSGMSVDTSKETELATELDSVSYLLGADYAEGLKTKAGLSEIDFKSFITGMQRVFEGKEVEISEEVAGTFMRAYFGKLEEAKGAVEKAASDSFCNANKAKADVKVTESGLQYKVLKEGTGEMPKTGQEVTVHYTGKLIDGTVFDSSIDRGEPAKFKTDQVIPGWTEALLMMPVGSKWELVIPSELAYGSRATGPIPANATLVFEVELLEITK
jgi:FKBP-type peptidyl-prolyl cis-trans isomerase FklB